MPKEEALVKQTQAMFLGGLSAKDVAVFYRSKSIKLEPLLKRFSQKNGTRQNNIVGFPYASADPVQGGPAPRVKNNFYNSLLY
jgi:hypothetical protein